MNTKASHRGTTQREELSQEKGGGTSRTCVAQSPWWGGVRAWAPHTEGLQWPQHMYSMIPSTASLLWGPGKCGSTKTGIPCLTAAQEAEGLIPWPFAVCDQALRAFCLWKRSKTERLSASGSWRWGSTFLFPPQVLFQHLSSFDPIHPTLASLTNSHPGELFSSDSRQSFP